MAEASKKEPNGEIVPFVVVGLGVGPLTDNAVANMCASNLSEAVE
jgi:hypothetical protein